MPRVSSNVLATDRELRAATPQAGFARTDYRIKGAPGLQLRVSARGTKTWTFVYKSPATGKWAKVALGHFSSVELAEAKGRALDVAAEVRKGRDPIHDKAQEFLLETFASLAKRYMREHEKRNARGGRTAASTREAQRQLDQDILPTLGRMRVDAITKQHVMHVVEAISDRGSYVAADRALGLVRAIYNWACGTGRTERNPTISLKKRNAGRTRSRVLSTDEIRAFWIAVESIGSITPPLRDALRIQLLTAARISEVLEAPLDELNLAEGIWTIGALRTKSEREHTIPLSPMAVAIFEKAIERGREEERRRASRAGREPQIVRWVFPSFETSRPITGRAATRSCVRNRAKFQRAGLKASFNTHDLRRTAATQLGEMHVPAEVIERILNHAPRTVADKHYNRARYLPAMRQALSEWAGRLHFIVATEGEK